MRLKRKVIVPWPIWMAAAWPLNILRTSSDWTISHTLNTDSIRQTVSFSLHTIFLVNRGYPNDLIGTREILATFVGKQSVGLALVGYHVVDVKIGHVLYAPLDRRSSRRADQIWSYSWFEVGSSTQ